MRLNCCPLNVALSARQCFPSFRRTVLFIVNGQMDQEEFLLHLTLGNEDITFLKTSGAFPQRRSTTPERTGTLKFALDFAKT